MRTSDRVVEWLNESPRLVEKAGKGLWWLLKAAGVVLLIVLLVAAVLSPFAHDRLGGAIAVLALGWLLYSVLEALDSDK